MLLTTDEMKDEAKGPSYGNAMCVYVVEARRRDGLPLWAMHSFANSNTEVDRILAKLAGRETYVITYR